MVASSFVAVSAISGGVGSVVWPLLWQHLTVRYEANKGVSATTIYGAADAAPPGGKELASRLERILGRSSLESPRYVPPSFAMGSTANAGLALIKRKLARMPLEHERLADPDLCISWAADRVSRALPPTAPVVAFLHTINGNAEQSKHLCCWAASRGWRSVVLVRRGHAGPLSTPRFNILGSIDDTTTQLAAVRERWPEASFVGLVGLSAGSGLLVNYLGHHAAHAAVDAAVGASPAYDISEAFKGLTAESPLAERYMVNALKATFLEPNEALLRAAYPAAFDACLAADTLTQFIAAHAPFALSDEGAGEEAYYEACNPMKRYSGVAVPLLFINSDDDMVCSKRHIREDLVKSTPGVALVRTKRGSHVAFNEGLLGMSSFLGRVAFDFLDSARVVADEDAVHVQRGAMASAHPPGVAATASAGSGAAPRP
jgi:predicted alpha/beta-fold hydrolase